MIIKVAALINDSIVDGPGFRYAVYTQGCSHNCKGCHNPQTHSFDGGYETDTEKIFREISENPLLSGITFSGGDPFFQPLPCAELAVSAHENHLNVWAYTGFTFEQLLAKNDAGMMAFLKEIDVLVDGRFVLEKRTLELPFRGSTNQRLIDVPLSLKANEVVEFKL